MRHLARLTLDGVMKTPLAEVEFTAPDDISDFDLLVLAGKASGDAIYMEVIPLGPDLEPDAPTRTTEPNPNQVI